MPDTNLNVRPKFACSLPMFGVFQLVVLAIKSKFKIYNRCQEKAPVNCKAKLLECEVMQWFST